MDQSCDIRGACNLFRSLVFNLSFEFDTSNVVARQSFNPHLKNQETQDAFNQTRERERETDGWMAYVGD